MPELRFGLIGEGPTDRALLIVIRWLLRELLTGVEITGTWTDVDRRSAGRGLPNRLIASVKGEHLDIVFVHRDADNTGRASRVAEVARAVTAVRVPLPPVIAAVPVRMLETWLLADEAAIRRAAGNPNGRPLRTMLQTRHLESIADPKTLLRDLTAAASGLGAHRRRGIAVDHVGIAEATESFAILRQLPAFQAFEADVRRVIAEQGWPERLG